MQSDLGWCTMVTAVADPGRHSWLPSLRLARKGDGWGEPTLSAHKGYPDYQAGTGTTTGWELDIHLGIVWLVSALLAGTIVSPVPLGAFRLSLEQSRQKRGT